jgi:hypothetical protein
MFTKRVQLVIISLKFNIGAIFSLSVTFQEQMEAM